MEGSVKGGDDVFNRGGAARIPKVLDFHESSAMVIQFEDNSAFPVSSTEQPAPRLGHISAQLWG
jgi:hypothetical protein